MGDMDSAQEELLQKAINIQEKALGKEHPATAESYNDLGSVMMCDLGDLDGAMLISHL